MSSGEYQPFHLRPNVLSWINSFGLDLQGTYDERGGGDTTKGGTHLTHMKNMGFATVS